jgi:hypothetical protein
MPVFTVHEPPRSEDDEDALAHATRFTFVRDGFHFWAFLLAPLWMLRHRMWLEFIAYLLLTAGITFALQGLNVTGSAGLWVALLLAVLVGMEAPSLRRWKLSRRGFGNVGLVVGKDREEAERRFFDSWATGDRENVRRDVEPSVPAPTVPSPFGAAPSSDIVGLFPQPGARA